MKGNDFCVKSMTKRHDGCGVLLLQANRRLALQGPSSQELLSMVGTLMIYTMVVIASEPEL